ncbi:MAG: ThiF family adenylyltransferase [Myxococcota bacterium]
MTTSGWKVDALLGAHGQAPEPRGGVLVIERDLLVQAFGGSGRFLFGRREAHDGEELVRAHALEPGGGLEPVAMLGAGSDGGGLVLTGTAEQPTAHRGGVPWEVLVVDPGRYRDRVRALPGVGAVTGRSVVLVGLGSVGSSIGSRLVRLGVAVDGCDPDRLMPENLIRWGLDAAPEVHVGRRKAHAWENVLEATVPDAAVRGHAIDVVRQPVAFDRLLDERKPDLLIVATDTRDSRRTANAAAARHDVPALYVSLSDGASSVRVEVVEDARRGPCHLCAAAAEGSGDLASSGLRRSRTPYATESAGADAGVPALPVQVAMGCAVAGRVALALLAGEPWRGYFRRGTQDGNVLFMSLRPDWWIFEEPWERLVYAAERHRECPTCGGGESGHGD